MRIVSSLAFSHVLLVSLALIAPAFATAPGTPMDCSDLELAPGLTCTAVPGPRIGVPRQSVLDNDGRALIPGSGSSEDILEVVGSCGSTNLVRAALLYGDELDGSRTPLVTVRWRCLDAAAGRFELVRFGSALFHAVPGSLLVAALSACSPLPGTEVCPDYASVFWTARIDGFTPLADVLPPPRPQCGNGVDDDEDGRIDRADAGCKSDADNDEARP